MSQYYYRIFGDEIGPISLELLLREITSGHLSIAHEVRCAGETSWVRVADFIAQRVINHTPASLTTHPILAGDGGHGEFEAVETVFKQPGTENMSATETVDQWFCRGLRVGLGPHTFDDLRSLVRSGELVADDELSFSEDGPWVTVASVGRLMADMPFPLAQNSSPSSTISNGSNESDVKSSSISVLTEHQPEQEAVQTTTQWYARMGKVERGPMEFQTLIGMAKAGHILPMDRVRKSDETEWTMAGKISGLFSSKIGSYQSFAQNVSPKPRPSLLPLLDFARREHLSQTARIRPTAPALIPQAGCETSMLTSPAPMHPAAEKPVLVPLPANTEPSAPPMMMSGPELRTESRPQIKEKAPEIVHSPPRGGGAVEVDRSSDQTIRRPQDHVDSESKHKLRRGQFREAQLGDRGSVMIAASLGVVALLFFGWQLLPVSVGRFEEPYGELAAIYQTLDDKWSQRPTEEFWMITKKEVVYKIESAKRKIKSLHSQHQIRHNLIYASDCMIWAAKADSRNEITLFMEQAKKNLDRSREDLQAASQPKK